MQDTENANPLSEGDERFIEPDEMPGLPEDMDPLPETIKPKIPEVDAVPPPPETTDTPEGETGEPIVEAPPPEDSPPVEEKAEESKARRFFRKFIRWTAGLLIIFGLGLIIGIFVLYRPAVQEAENNSRLMMADLDSANGQILELENQVSDLKSQISSLQPLKERNSDLTAEQKDLNLHIAILDARVDVAGALLALSEGDSAQALIVLAKTAKTLETINGLLETDQQEVITTLKQRLDLVMGEVDDDPFAARSDLEVLATKLLQLEDSLFTE
jgi:cytoskeletal protein RodZ